MLGTRGRLRIHLTKAVIVSEFRVDADHLFYLLFSPSQ
jgi:hypothetical protein